MKRITAVLMLLLLLTGCGNPAEPPTVPMVTAPPVTIPPTTETTVPPTTEPPIRNGWSQEEGQWYFFVQDVPLTGWQQLDGKWYYLGETGAMYTGYLDYDGHTYYFREDGTMAVGEVTVDGRNYHFTAEGHRILLVNPWNTVPEDYEPSLMGVGPYYATSGTYVDVSCYNDLIDMITECNRVCPHVCIVSSYRTQEYQERLYENKVQRVMAGQKVDREEAMVLAAKEVAVPGTSEHQLGLAVDIVDTRDWSLEYYQADLPAQQWLMKNSWRFGFILRYPEDKTAVTGIIYEPWHYRYVGKELAAYLYENDLTLEEYLQALTESAK